jgi:hypothetical protein
MGRVVTKIVWMKIGQCCFLFFPLFMVMTVQCNDFCTWFSDDMKAYLYNCCDIAECGHLATTCRNFNSIWKNVQLNDALRYLPYRLTTLGDQAYAQTIKNSDDTQNHLRSTFRSFCLPTLLP